ncbi:sensor histidine kinase [Pseudonocardiaceae bacterium YIM PH 21723]|nr:sensor histidine kinase [Pseudonocardiaceae bacterium YIM PH 21723]
MSENPTVNFLRGPFQAETWRAFLYLLVGLPMAIASLILFCVTVGAGTPLALLVFGLPVVAALLVIGRGLGGGYRGLARELLGAKIEEPAPQQPAAPGLVGWVKHQVLRPSSWRALLFHLVTFPITVTTFVLSIVFWALGPGLMTYWYWERFTAVWFDPNGEAHRGMMLGPYVPVDTPARMAGLAVLGVLIFWLSPVITRGLAGLHTMLVRGLLGVTAAERVAQLEQSRTHAVDDTAALLRRIERDLHDGAQARLVTVAMKLGEVKERLATGTGMDQARDLLDTAHQDAKEALTELRDLARGIHPPVLDNGLEPALTTLAARCVIPVTVRADAPVRPSQAIETIAYFCAAELLTNVVKHAGARAIYIELTTSDDQVQLRVSDDGTGGATLDGPGTGLIGLRERVRTVDGTLSVTSPPGGPTSVTVDLPAHA